MYRLLFILIIFIPCISYGECNDAQKNNLINSEIKLIENVDPRKFTNVKVWVPYIFEGIPLVSMEVIDNKIENSNISIPLEYKTRFYKKHGIDMAYATFVGYKDSIEDFHIIIGYADSSCVKNIEISITDKTSRSVRN